MQYKNIGQQAALMQHPQVDLRVIIIIRIFCLFLKS